MKSRNLITAGSTALCLTMLANNSEAEGPTCTAGDDWITCFRAAENEYQTLMLRWREVLKQSATSNGAQTASRLDLRIQLDGLDGRQSALQARKVELNRTMSAIQQRQNDRDVVLDDFDDRIQDQRSRVEQAVADLAMALEATPRSGAARATLDGWWNAHRFLDWAALVDYGRDPRDPFRRDLEVAAAALGEGPSSAVAALMRLADEERTVRESQRDYLSRSPEPESLDAIQEELASLDQELRRGDAARAEVQAKLDALALPSASDPVSLLMVESGGLAFQYARLQSYFEEDPRRVTEALPREMWCALYVHGGIAGSLAGFPSGLDTLRNGVSTYDTSCVESLAHDLDILPVQAAWARALYLESQEPPAWVIIDNVKGSWTLDGREILGTGPVRLVVGAGTHLIAFTHGPDGPSDLLVEDFKGGDHLGLHADQGRIVLDVLPVGTPEWLIPVRREVFTVAVEPPPPYELDWRVSVLGTALAFEGESVVGGSVEGLHSALRYGPLRLEAGAALDWLGSDQAYAYGRSSTSAMIRVRGLVLARYASGRLRPLVTLSPGFIPPFQAITLDGAAGLDYRLNERLSASGRIGLTSSFWRHDVTWLEPMAQLGLSAWY